MRDLKVKCAAIVAAASVSTQAASILTAGDIAISDLSTGGDSWKFVALKNIEAGTVIRFTDNGWTGSAWRTATDGALSETSITYVAPSGGLTAGTVVPLNGLSLSNSGDNIFAFQNTWANPTFVAGAIADRATGWLTTGTADSSSSYLPSQLSDGTNAVYSGGTGDYAAASGAPASGTTAAIRTGINTTSNWTRGSTAITSPSSFSVTDAANASAATSTTAIYDFGPDSAGYTVAPKKVSGANGDRIAFGSFQQKSGAAVVVDSNGGNGFDSQDFGVDPSTTFSTSSTLDTATDVAFGVTAAVEAGYEFDLETVSFYYQPKTNGPRSFALFVSEAGGDFQQLGDTVTPGNTTWNLFTLTDLNTDAYAGDLEFRIYAWNSSSATVGELEIDEFRVSGVVSAVPEPGSLALLGAGALMTLRRRRREGRA